MELRTMRDQEMLPLGVGVPESGVFLGSFEMRDEYR